MCLSSRTHWMRTTSSGDCEDRGPQAMVKSFMSLMDCLRAAMDSGVIWTISPSSTMLDLAFSPELGFNAPLNTTKLAPVTKIKTCTFKIFSIYNLTNWDIEKFSCERLSYNINDHLKHEYSIYTSIEPIIYYKAGFLPFNACEFFSIFQRFFWLTILRWTCIWSTPISLSYLSVACSVCWWPESDNFRRRFGYTPNVSRPPYWSKLRWPSHAHCYSPLLSSTV